MDSLYCADDGTEEATRTRGRSEGLYQYKGCQTYKHLENNNKIYLYFIPMMCVCVRQALRPRHAILRLDARIAILGRPERAVKRCRHESRPTGASPLTS